MADRDSRQDVDWGWGGGGGGGGKGWGMEGDKFIADRKTGSWFGEQTDIQEVQGLPTDRPRHKFSCAGQEVPGLQTERKLTDRQTDRQADR